MVTCKLCNAQFPPSGGEMQGHGCASSISVQADGSAFVQGFYGSRLFDMSRYKFIGNELRPIPRESIRPVCDICVEKMVRMEAISYDRECEP